MRGCVLHILYVCVCKFMLWVSATFVPSSNRPRHIRTWDCWCWSLVQFLYIRGRWAWRTFGEAQRKNRFTSPEFRYECVFVCVHVFRWSAGLEFGGWEYAVWPNMQQHDMVVGWVGKLYRIYGVLIINKQVWFLIFAAERELVAWKKEKHHVELVSINLFPYYLD